VRVGVLTLAGAGIVLVAAFSQSETVGEAAAVALVAVWLYTFWQYRKR
jgi:hypothetical protein